jgi:hypothetical protein
MDDIKLYQLAVALEQDATWDSGGGCVGVMVTKGDHEVFFGFADGYLGWDWYQISKAEDQFLLVGSSNGPPRIGPAWMGGCSSASPANR